MRVREGCSTRPRDQPETARLAELLVERRDGVGAPPLREDQEGGIDEAGGRAAWPWNRSQASTSFGAAGTNSTSLAWSSWPASTVVAKPARWRSTSTISTSTHSWTRSGGAPARARIAEEEAAWCASRLF